MQRYLARKEQQGVSLSGLLLWSVVVVMIVILGMRLLPIVYGAYCNQACLGFDSQ
jgi:hypothetical protein